MALRKENYRAVAVLRVAARCPGDAALDGLAVAVSCRKGALDVTLSSSGNRATTVQVVWAFEDWFDEDSGQDFQESSWDLWERSGVLFIPDDHGSTDFRKGIAVGEILLAAITPYLARLSLVSRSPYFWSRVRAADLGDLAGEVHVTVGGRTAKLRQVMWRALPDVRPSPVDAPHARSLAASSFPQYGGFMLTADRRFMEGDRPDAVVHLAQGLEIAAYGYIRARVAAAVGSRDWNFSAPHYFGPPGIRRSEVQAINAQPLPEYPAVCELFGARHEWVHEGRAQVRPYDPARSTVTSDPAKYRALTFEDYYRFRRAVSAALVWMGELPIE